MDRDEMRMKLWVDVYVAAITSPGHTKPCCDYATGALADFDEAFPEKDCDHGPPPQTD